VLGDRGDAQSMIRTRRGLGHVLVAPVVPRTWSQASPAAGAAAPPFVGRATELQQLLSGLRPGAAKLSLVFGEAGAGKSRLIDEVRAHATELTARWGVGHALSGEHVPALWPFRQIWNALAPTLTAADVAWDCERKVAAAVSDLARTTPLVLVIEDLHWADERSLHVLELLIRSSQSGLHVIATCRSQEARRQRALSQALSRWLGRTGVRSVELGPLGASEIEGWVRAVAPAQAAREIAVRLLGLSGGNPLFCEQLLRHWPAHGFAASPLPQTLQLVALARIAPLTAATRALIEQAAVFGPELTLPLMAAMTGRSVLQLRRALEPLRELGILQRGPRPDQLTFVHGLLQDAIYASLAPQRRAHLHGRALRAARRLPRGYEQSSALARHAFLSGATLSSLRVQRLCERAGRQSFEAHSFEHAAEQLERALALLPAANKSKRRRAELTLLWARALASGRRSLPSTRRVRRGRGARASGRCLGAVRAGRDRSRDRRGFASRARFGDRSPCGHRALGRGPRARAGRSAGAVPARGARAVLAARSRR
jgi:hypothetical protein